MWLLSARPRRAARVTSLGHVRRLVATADSEHVEQRIEGGLSSGEGLVYAVRDATTKSVENKETGEWESQVVDPGVEDKRLLVLEGAFSGVLKVMGRPGNTLSPTIRNLWDRGSAGALTKHDRTRCRDAHVSIIGHIVRDELRRELTQTELGNGFANRFLFVCAQRSRLLPDGGSINDGVLSVMAFELQRKVAEARVIGLGSPMA